MIRVVLPAQAEEHISFAMSPLLECVLSLHVLVGPKHHALQHAWVRRMRRLDPALRRRIDYFGFVYRTHLPDVLMPQAEGPSEDFENELVRLQRFAPEQLLSALARPMVDHGGRQMLDDDARQTALARAIAGGPELHHAVSLLLDDPAAFTAAFAEMLADYWSAAFEDAWSRIEEPLGRSIIEAGHLLAGDGAWSVLGRLPPRCRIDRDHGELLVDLPHDHRVEVSLARPLVLTPSYFVWPHLQINCDEPWPLAIVYTASQVAREAEPRIPEAELLRTLRAVADDTRLRILRLIAERPRSTQELEPLVGLSRAGLSKSLQRLAEAGLITPKREGYYVVYSLVPGRVESLAPAILRFLDPQQPFDGERSDA